MNILAKILATLTYPLFLGLRQPDPDGKDKGIWADLKGIWTNKE